LFRESKDFVRWPEVARARSGEARTGYSALTSVLAFWILFGMIGVLLATPLMVAVMVLVQKLYIEMWSSDRSNES
jgi:hypothetical protein